MSAHNQAVQCATTRIVIDGYEKQIKRLEKRLAAVEREARLLREMNSTLKSSSYMRVERKSA